MYTEAQINFGDLAPYLTYDSHSEGIELFIEGQAVMRSYDSASRPSLSPAPLPSVSSTGDTQED
jgi:hypothetical protein